MTAHCQAPHCGRPLHTEESKARGYGPVCWSRTHPAAPRIATPEHAIDPNQIPLPLEDIVDAETRKAAIDTVARHAIARELAHAVSCNRIDWGDYPDLSEADWDAVLARAAAIGQSIAPAEDAYTAAYEHLTVQEGQPA